MQTSQAPSSPRSSIPQDCAGCKKSITERFMLQTMDQFWHEDCLKCSCCECRLGEVGSTLYTKANLLLCRRDYLRICIHCFHFYVRLRKGILCKFIPQERLFGATGNCSVCSKVIPAFEMVMKAKENVYHLECFACQQCNHRFCIGDRYYLCDNQILCELDYEDRLMLSRVSNSAPHQKQKLANPVGLMQSPAAPNVPIGRNETATC